MTGLQTAAVRWAHYEQVFARMQMPRQMLSFARQCYYLGVFETVAQLLDDGHPPKLRPDIAFVVESLVREMETHTMSELLATKAANDAEAAAAEMGSQTDPSG